MDDYNDPYLDHDDASVGSLAILETDSGVGGGAGGGRRSSMRKNNDDADDRSVDSDSPLGMIRQRSKTVSRLRFSLFILLILGGVGLSVGALLFGLHDARGGDNKNNSENSGGGGGASQGAIFAGIVGGTFLLILVVFLRYDAVVAERHAIVNDLARRSRSLVDSLFPSTVRDRLFNFGGGGNSSGVNGTDHLSSNHSNASDAEGYPILDVEAQTKRNTRANQKLACAEFILPNSGINKSALLSKVPTSNVAKYLKQTPEGRKLQDEQQLAEENPIADSFPHTTVFFCDISGFTAWSSVREPTQVFRLLETVYSTFDEWAEKLKVFKVETIGDSYMAVTGLPEPDEKHAVSMAKFAYKCLTSFDSITRDLEPSLGPGTRELNIRVGLHSGPVTAGVLRGQKSRFQLFGDTVNTASRMESTGQPGRIQVSQETADYLVAAGKLHWLKPRQDKIVAKGKGELTTFWLEKSSKKSALAELSGDETELQDYTEFPLDMLPETFAGVERPLEAITEHRPQEKNHKTEVVTPQNRVLRLVSPMRPQREKKYQRLIDWNTDLLMELLERVMSVRKRQSSRGSRSVKDVTHSEEISDMPPALELVTDLIILPDFDPYARPQRPDPALLRSVRDDLHQFVSEICVMYNDVAFHNFEHASHVALASSKLLSRMSKSKTLADYELHNITYGISSDPLTQFSVVLAALVHDVGHAGIPNAQLVTEENEVAVCYKNRSVAEQNSVALTWQLLLEPRYQKLRSCIYRDNVERKRFRQVLINAVMATDIADRDTNQLRMKKWDKAFHKEDERGNEEHMTRDEINRKATVVIENMIQVADVAHTMQHWHIYRRWNERLFEEMTLAYRTGRASFDPATTWYNGEIGFYDFYIIPLAKKLHESGIFGVAGEQYIAYATANRNEWEKKGQKALKDMIEANQAVELVSCAGSEADSDAPAL